MYNLKLINDLRFSKCSFLYSVIHTSHLAAYLLLLNQHLLNHVLNQNSFLF